MASSPPFDPVEFLRFAAELHGGDPTEARLRTAVRRVYYGVFRLAREYLGIADRRDVHRIVLAELSARGHEGIASKLGQLRSMREVADYQLVPTDTNRLDWQRNWRYARRVANLTLREMERAGWLEEPPLLLL